jgi:transcriptional regulator with XRE-family HTH domain
MIARELRFRRLTARIPGWAVAGRVGISRGRLSEIERGRVVATPDELVRISDALDQLIDAKSKVAQIAAQVGWPVGADV